MEDLRTHDENNEMFVKIYVLIWLRVRIAGYIFKP
jgi:hypothetical protein